MKLERGDIGYDIGILFEVLRVDEVLNLVYFLPGSTFKIIAQNDETVELEFINIMQPFRFHSSQKVTRQIILDAYNKVSI